MELLNSTHMIIYRGFQMSTKFRRMADSDIKSIISDLDRWAAGQLGAKLTWGVLEERFGFSRQSLQAKPEIKAAYDYAKSALSGGLVISREMANKNIDELQREVEQLKLEVAEYKRKETLWQGRWQRIAYNIRQKGLQVPQINCNIAKSSLSLSANEVTKIIQIFYVDILGNGRP